jgi:trimethylamine:corrinoid methyltransferase-like protein
MADYYSVIANAISRSSSQTDEDRRAIYERARTALREALRDYEPPLLANELVALEAAVCRLEADLVFP